MKLIFISLIAIANSHCEKDVPVFNPSQSCGNDLVISDSLYQNALLPDSCLDTINGNHIWNLLNHYYYNIFMLSFNASSGTDDTIKELYFMNDCINIPLTYGGTKPFYLIWDGKSIKNNSNQAEMNLLLYFDYSCGFDNPIALSGYYSWNLEALKKQVQIQYTNVKSAKIIINPHLNNDNRREIIYSF
ncbi:MAG: hypothetical protein HY841_06995 [Bacteroidetes bacterium]|nr:hypothetical protein [Bacteroidota bacterium]